MTKKFLLPSSQQPLVRWGQLYGAATALKLAEAAQQLNQPLLVITADTLELNRLEDELQVFLTDAFKVQAFPAWETLSYDLFAPHPDLVSQRLNCLSQLPTLTHGIVLIDIETFAQRLPPRKFIDAHAFDLTVGTTLKLQAFRERLSTAGYANASQVMAPGEFAIRGSIMDVYPMGSATPFRLDFMDDEIDSIRTFDVDSQRTLERVEQIKLLPAREFPFNTAGIQYFKRRFRTRFSGDLTRVALYKDLTPEHAPPGIEYYLPLFFDHTAHLLEYLPATTVVACTLEWSQLLHTLQDNVHNRYEQRQHDIERPILSPEEIYLSHDETTTLLKRYKRIEWCHAALDPNQQHLPWQNFSTTAPPNVRLDVRATEPAQRLIDFLQHNTGRTLIAAESAGRREMLMEVLRKHQLQLPVVTGWHEFIASTLPVAITISPLASGLVLPDGDGTLTLIAEEQLFGERARQERRRRADRDPGKIIRDLSDLTLRAPVVHEEYGVGRYLGLCSMDVGGLMGEFLILEYAEGDKIYVPVQALDLISRYTGTAPDQAPLHKLGSDAWQKARKKAAQKIRDTAAELLDLYARRAAREGEVAQADASELHAFAAAFRFEETPDQAQAIEAVINDLANPKPMDRVICGDVGFGKTEVALRAAFVAVQAGKQVAVLVPTTLLAQQHYQTFSDRFADWPVRVDSLSRFRSTAQTQAVIRDLKTGTIDIVIGTHRLLQGQVQFKNLGLIIVDEEHRFGVKDKERLKQWRANVDVLTLTATPIPRTLNMAMGGLRDLSLITTPPTTRLAIKTFVLQWDGATVREACLRELRRGGQIYYVHNSVESIEKTATALTTLIPEAKIAIGHGQMSERALEQIMLDFYHQRCNLLLCTTIVESGIDVPSANTIIIDRADKLGLSQLHQLRGRVGRSHHQAYAYLLTPPRNLITADAVKRLEAIESLEDLGAGFALATHDLEIRGAGELLGEEQSGQMQEIGFTLYLELLERAVTALKAGNPIDLEQPLHRGPEVDLHVVALLPDTYMPDVHLRLVLYKRIAAAESTAALHELQVEMIDRFGLLPEPAHNLLQIAQLKLQAKALGIHKLDLHANGGSITFRQDTCIDVGVLMHYVQRNIKTHRFDGPQRVKFSLPLATDKARVTAAEQLLAALAPTSSH